MSMQIVTLDPAEARGWLPAAVGVYVAAMGYPRGTESHRIPMWREHLHRPGWSGLAAMDDQTLVGIAYGYRGREDQWWNQQLRDGLTQRGARESYIDDVTGDYFELTELHLHPDHQGNGMGEALLRELLAHRREPQVLLSTPEIAHENNRAWQLYRRLGFADVLRNFYFRGDPRPFAVLGRTLPL